MGSNGLPPRFVAHQHARDLFLVALLATHPRPQRVMGEFRRLVDDLAGLDADSLDDQTYLALVQRSAAAFDRMIQGVLLATTAGHSPEVVAAKEAPDHGRPVKDVRAELGRSGKTLPE